MSSLTITKEKTRQVFLIIFVLLVLLIHTSWIGRIVNELFLYIPLIGVLFILFLFEKKLRLTSPKFIMLCLSTFFLLWICLQVLIINPAGWYNVASTVVGIFLTIIGSAFFIKNRDAQLVLKTIVIVVIILSLSQMITIIFHFIGLGEATRILVVDTAEKFGAKAVMIQPLTWYFPYTFTAHIAKVNNFVFPRAIGLWREPGIYQMFVVVSYFSLDFIDIKHKVLLRTILILSLLSVFSTAGYAIFLSCLGYKYIVIMRRKKYLKRLIGLFLILLFIGMFLTTSASFGLQQKLEHNWKRLETPQLSYDLLMQRPLLGYSIADDITVESQATFSKEKDVNLGINFLSSIHKFGLIGLFLYFSLIYFSIRQFYNLNTLILLLPILATLLISQPIFIAEFVFLMLFLPVSYISRVKQVEKMPVFELPTTLHSGL